MQPAMSPNHSLVFEFTRVEEKPLLEFKPGIMLSVVALVTLIIGFGVTLKTLKILWTKKKSGEVVAIDKLLLTYCSVSGLLHPPLLVYYVIKPLYFPMVNLVGFYGCGILILFMDMYVRMQGIVMPFAIAVMRFVLIVGSRWFQPSKIKKFSKIINALAILVPGFMTLCVQLPPAEFTQGPYFYCLGRFEVYFNPLHPDPITPGRRKVGDYCVLIRTMAFSISANSSHKILKIVLCILCYTSKIFYYILVYGVTEMFLYGYLFRHIKKLDEKIASKGLLQADVMARRRQRNSINIYFTYWAWVIQFVVNFSNMAAVTFLFGRSLFFHGLLAILQIAFNFVILPLLYLSVVDTELKLLLHQGTIIEIIQYFL